MQISATDTMEMTAASRNTYSMIFSLFFIRASIYRFFLNNVYVPRKDRKNILFPRSVLLCYFQLSVLVCCIPGCCLACEDTLYSVRGEILYRVLLVYDHCDTVHGDLRCGKSFLCLGIL